MRLYSVIIPVYNRAEEIDELLESLTLQSYQHFEVLIIEDGSEHCCDSVVEKYSRQLNITYYFKPNSGQGFSRNFGFSRAKGDFFIVFDSDCIIPPHYFKTVDDYLNTHQLDAYGGPDKALDTFSAVQRAISYTMTSPFTTGGIRGGKKRMGAFHPRSFNMGISREVFEHTQGYIITRMGEDIEFSVRIITGGYKTGLIGEAFVYHKRRTGLKQFYNQVYFFGRARINISRFYPGEIKLVHAFPAIFTVGIALTALLFVVNLKLALVLLVIYILFFGLIFIDALIKERNISVAVLSIGAAFIQLFGYGLGFIAEGWKKLTNQD